MNKTELVAAIAEKAGISKKDADAAVAAFVATVTDAMKAGDKVIVAKFAGQELKLDGEDYSIVKIADVLAVVE